MKWRPISEKPELKKTVLIKIKIENNICIGFGYYDEGFWLKYPRCCCDCPDTNHYLFNENGHKIDDWNNLDIINWMYIKDLL